MPREGTAMPSQRVLFTKILTELIASGTPSRHVLALRMLAYVNDHPETAGRANRAKSLDSHKKAIDRWLTGIVPGSASWPMIAACLKKDVSNIERLCKTPIGHTWLQRQSDYGDYERDHLFDTLSNFFQVEEHNLKICRAAVGIYRVFFREVSDPDRVRIVCAAMRLHTDEGDRFFVEEYQEYTRLISIRRWSGYYVSRRNHIIMVVSGLGRSTSLPKFYILSPPDLDADDEHVLEMRGVVLTIGPNNNIFSTRILLQRDLEAFQKCEAVPIRGFLGPKKTEAAYILGLI
jgi:hypothetical protein